MARSIIENKCLEVSDRTLRQTAKFKTQRGHRGCYIAASKTSWVIDSPKLLLFENIAPNKILTIIFKF
jgi:hypothetical protein